MRRRTAKAQSAMEYLMTYGWAILIIAVVLGALFQLGVFNAGAFAPRAPPGACQVFRPNGPNTASLVNLEGVCSGELPQYVGVFNGQTGYINAGNQPVLQVQYLAASAWVNTNSIANWPDVVDQYNSCLTGWALRVSNAGSGYPEYVVNIGNSEYGIDSNLKIPLNSWVNLVETWNGVAVTGYMNGQLVAGPANPTFSGSISSTQSVLIGEGCGGYLSGSIANVQIYNTSLTSPEVNALYAEGIGGAPIKLSNLVSWWPLNGNANDYSGNNNNGVPSAVTYTNQWSSGYTAP